MAVFAVVGGACAPQPQHTPPSPAPSGGVSDASESSTTTIAIDVGNECGAVIDALDSGDDPVIHQALTALIDAVARVDATRRPALKELTERMDEGTDAAIDALSLVLPTTASWVACHEFNIMASERVSLAVPRAAGIIADLSAAVAAWAANPIPTYHYEVSFYSEIGESDDTVCGTSGSYIVQIIDGVAASATGTADGCVVDLEARDHMPLTIEDWFAWITNLLDEPVGDVSERHARFLTSGTPSEVFINTDRDFSEGRFSNVIAGIRAGDN